ncbi:MAG TPA: hypothetical protein VMG80_00660 [Solirubrobacteraceae bacterium]|nr:hypothetical protein [Solirubrobacteraceae bacterium]
MPQTKTKPRAPVRKAPASSERIVEKKRKAIPVDRTTELSEEVLKSLESGQRAAIEAVRKFVDTVDQTLPALGERPSRRQEIVDAALEMADRLVHTQYDFLHKVVHSAGKALSRPDDDK